MSQIFYDPFQTLSFCYKEKEQKIYIKASVNSWLHDGEFISTDRVKIGADGNFYRVLLALSGTIQSETGKYWLGDVYIELTDKAIPDYKSSMPIEQKINSVWTMLLDLYGVDMFFFVDTRIAETDGKTASNYIKKDGNVEIEA